MGAVPMKRPPLVEGAAALVGASGFRNSCLDEVGALLYVLAGHVPGGRIAEIGTGCGVGTAWMAAATSLAIYTIDNHPGRLAVARDLLADVPSVHCLLGDWHAVLDHGPFQLMFVDTRPAKEAAVDQVVKALAIGGLIVLDDFTPIECWPDEWQGRSDPVRDAWLNHSQLASVEIRTSSKAAAIIARRAT